jgi:UDP-N-acetylmuramate dehydrogenase
MSDALAAVTAHLEARVGDRLQRHAPIGPRTTYRVGGHAALLLEAATDDDLRAARDALAESGGDVPVLVVGNGSNLLVADAGFPGLAVVLGDGFASVAIEGTTVRAGGAALLPVVARRTAAAGLTGFEWAVGVPGSIGGAVRMNAGGHGSDMAASLRRVRVVDLGGGHDGWVPATDLDLGYRHSSVGPATVVVAAELALAVGDQAAAEAEIAEIVRWRRANQPGGQNAGSVFTNPDGDSAGRLIDEAGGKGRRVGSAQVSTKHANFIIADPDGRADDVVALMVAIRDLVAGTLGVVLEPETRLCGYVLPPVNPRVEIEG